MKILIMKNVALYSVAILSFCVFTPDANAQMNESPWGFNNQNRASIAALIQQVENADDANATGTSAGSVVNLVCGGDGADASASGNSICIIMNNSDGIFDLDQDNNGDQDAYTYSESTETTNVDETIYIEEVLETLSGDSENDGID